VDSSVHYTTIKRRIALRVFKRCTKRPAPQEIFLPDSLHYKLGRLLAWKKRRGESLAPDAPRITLDEPRIVVLMSARGRLAPPARWEGWHSSRRCLCTLPGSRAISTSGVCLAVWLRAGTSSSRAGSVGRLDGNPMNISLEDLQHEAAATGFLAETLEKALRLLSLLNALRSHQFLRTRMALRAARP
jgi:hypothetical protein